MKGIPSGMLAFLHEIVGTDFKGPAGLPLQKKHGMGRGVANKGAVPELLNAIPVGLMHAVLLRVRDQSDSQ